MKKEHIDAVISVTAALVQDPVDKLGTLQAKVAEDVKEIERLKEALKKRGPGKYEGALYSATVSQTERESLIAEKVRGYLSPQQLVHAVRSTPVVKVTVTGKQVA